MQKSFTLKELAELTESTLIGNPETIITNVETLELATQTDASFLASPRYEQAMIRSNAGVVFIASDQSLPTGRNFLITKDPSIAFQKTVEAFYEDTEELMPFPSRHETAVIHETAIIAKDAIIGPHVVIDKNCKVGSKSHISAGCVLGANVSIGEDCLLHPRVNIGARCTLGNRVVIQSGAVIGSCGFGFTTDKNGKHSKINQLGNVCIEDDVEIGANTTIDRARFKTTKIGKGTKIDNLVQIAHGVEIGQDCLIISQTGIAGSTKLGNHVVLAGQVGICGHLNIGDKVVVSARSGVSKSLKKSGAYGGAPAMPMDEHNRTTVFIRKIESYVARIKKLEEIIENITQAKP